MLTGVICIIISLCCLAYSLCAFQEKGPLLMTTYFIASPKERAKMKNKREYRFVATVFLLIAILVGILGVGMIFNIGGTSTVSTFILMITAIYAVVVSIKHSIKK